MDYSKYQLVYAGDFAMNPMDLITGGVDIATHVGVTSPDYRVVSLKSPHDYCDLFLLNVFQYLYRNQIFFAYGQGSSQLGRWRLPRQQFNSFSFPIPPKAEQTMIAGFLDGETAKIDALVREQQRLIELLIEKRQAVISHAVTKGLNPYAPVKPSGIEWLGDVPEHWTTTKLKHLGQAQIGLTYDPAEIVDEPDGTLVLRSSNVQGGRIVFDDNVFVQKKIPPRLVTQLGDILICSRNGSRALIGKNAMIDHDAAGMTFGAFMTIFRSDLNRFLYWVFNSQIFELQSASFLTSTINQLTIGNLNSFAVLLPPANEQTLIAEFLDRETIKIDALTAEAQRAIDLLQERRTALISVAVTGKIDVRGLVQTEAA